MKKLFNVSPGAFRPPPKVDSAVVRMEPLAEDPRLDAIPFDELLRSAFSPRRKQLRNALPLWLINCWLSVGKRWFNCRCWI